MVAPNRHNQGRVLIRRNASIIALLSKTLGSWDFGEPVKLVELEDLEDLEDLGF